MFNELGCYDNSTTCAAEKNVDERVAAIFLGSDDPHLVADYHTSNGLSGHTKSDIV